MTRPLRIVAVSGGLQRPSRAAALAEHLLDLIGEDIHSEQQLIELGELAPQLAGALWRSQLPEAVERQLVAVEQADVLVVATPVYRGSYTGLFKHFFDFIDQDALVDALEGKRIEAALLDVTDPEPLPEDHPLWSLDNAQVTMHLSGRAQSKMFQRSADRFIENLARWHAGEPVEPRFDPALGY